MVRMVRAVARNLWVTAATLVVASACNDPQSPKLQDNATSEVELLVTEGAALAVEVATTVSVSGLGSDIPQDGYTVWVDASRSQSVGLTGIAAFSGLAAGDHSVALYGIPSNCIVSTLGKGPNNPRGVSLVADLAGSTDFSVGCSAWGGLFVSTHTTGVDLDPDGYIVTVDGGASQAIAANGKATFTELFRDDHTVALSGIAGNCTLSGPNPRTVTVSPGRTTSLTFSTSCTPTGTGTGILSVTTVSTGSNLPVDGYTVTVDGTLSQAIATSNDTVTFTVPAGEHPVVLSGVASNCEASGANPRTVAVLADVTATTTFEVTCVVPQPRVTGKGQTGIGSPTPHGGVVTFDFDVKADLTGRFTITAWDDLHPNGSPPTFSTDASTDPATSITAFREGSAVCKDPSRGVEIDGFGRGDEGSVVGYAVIVCDDGPEASDQDLVSFYIPSEGNGRSGMVTSGDIVKK